jgi:hypothetical protein
VDPLAQYRRPADQVMRLVRMGSAHPMRLSFLRILLRRVSRDNWRFEQSVWNVDDRGVGHAVYRAIGPERTYSLVAFAHDLPDEMRSDRVIATAWDATFTLVDGDVSGDDIKRLSHNVPLQEAGRITQRELCLSRANRSVRLFKSVIDALKNGQQPSARELDDVGYLMRTTAVYGSGKFGAQDYPAVSDRPEFSPPFQAEMLSVWLIRWFSVDIVNHMAAVCGGSNATTLDPVLARRLGVGNSTGLGMAPFLVRHPQLINNWLSAREDALARVRSQRALNGDAFETFRIALSDAIENARLWHSEHPLQVDKLASLRDDLSLLETYILNWDTKSDHPWDTLWHWAEHTLSLEGQEALVALMLEPHGDLIDDLSDCLSDLGGGDCMIDGAMTTQSLIDLITASYQWALSIDFEAAHENALFWYVSEEKLEPRLGQRADEEGSDLEQPLDIARAVARLWRDLLAWSGDETVAAFLSANPNHRLIVRRVQTSLSRPYGEVRDNVIAADTLPIDLMRCKLAFFGASRFDPRSDKWVRISLFQDLPYPLDICAG